MRRNIPFSTAPGVARPPPTPAWTAAALHDKAVSVLGSAANADAWMRHPLMALDGTRPMDLLATDAGRAEVGTLLVQLEYCVYV